MSFDLDTESPASANFTRIRNRVVYVPTLDGSEGRLVVSETASKQHDKDEVDNDGSSTDIEEEMDSVLQEAQLHKDAPFFPAYTQSKRVEQSILKTKYRIMSNVVLHVYILLGRKRYCFQ